MDTAQHNLLVISDLHLGEDVGREPLAHVQRAERDLTAFLAYYAAHRLDDLPWRLVINGDMIDLLGIRLMPEDAELIVGLHPDDHLYGIGAGPRSARIKIERVVARHRRVFAALAHFVGIGNELSLVLGNHDVELHWEPAQAALQGGLLALWRQDPSHGQPESRSDDQFQQAVQFHPWFYFEPEVLWAEHGHQYDPYCSFDNLLNPVDPDGAEIDFNAGSAASRYIKNHYRMHYEHGEPGFWGYIAFMLGEGAGRAFGIMAAYAAMHLRLFRTWLQRTPERVRALRAVHLQRLRTLAERMRVPEKILLELDGLHMRPLTLDVVGTMRAFMTDRLLLALAGVIAVLGLTSALPWVWGQLAAGLLAAGLLAADQQLKAWRASIYPQRRMRRIARRIRDLVRAPIVTFGHAHEATAEIDADGTWYINTGTWVAESKGSVAGSFTHLRIRRTPKGPLPELMQWRKGRSLAFRAAPLREAI